MKLAIAGLLLCSLAGCVTDAPSHVHFGGMSRVERAGVVATDSGCDIASARDHRDPSSQCFVSRRGSEN